MVKESCEVRRHAALPRAPRLHGAITSCRTWSRRSTRRSPSTCGRRWARRTSSTASGKGSVGFALTALQRRLASSPEAIYQSLKRRRERLRRGCEEERERGTGCLEPGRRAADASRRSREADDELTAEETSGNRGAGRPGHRGPHGRMSWSGNRHPAGWRRRPTTWCAPGRTASGTSSRTPAERPELFRDAAGGWRKLIIFSEHRDTLNYLRRKIAGVLGNERSRHHHPRRHAPRRAAASPGAVPLRPLTCRSWSRPMPRAKA